VLSITTTCGEWICSHKSGRSVLIRIGRFVVSIESDLWEEVRGHFGERREASDRPEYAICQARFRRRTRHRNAVRQQRMMDGKCNVTIETAQAPLRLEVLLNAVRNRERPIAGLVISAVHKENRWRYTFRAITQEKYFIDHRLQNAFICFVYDSSHCWVSPKSCEVKQFHAVSLDLEMYYLSMRPMKVLVQCCFRDRTGQRQRWDGHNVYGCVSFSLYCS
jgi:hypothetical protein